MSFPDSSAPVPSGEVLAGTAAPAVIPPRRSLSVWEWRLLAVLLVIFLIRNFPPRLDDFDQAKQAFTSLEMVQGGQWWFQHTPGGRAIATKPPLVGWAAAAVYKIGGNWEAAWWLPSLAAAMALVVLLWRAGEHLWPGAGGPLAAAAFGFNLLTPHLATLVRTDMPLALWITLAGLTVWRHVREGGSAWTPQSRGMIFGVLLAAMMTKGPILYAFLLPGMVVLTWIEHRRGGRPGLVWGGWWHWTLPLLPFLFWLERGMVTMPGFYDQVVVREFLGRFTVGEKAVHHNQPIWYYFGQLLTRWAPWSVLLLAVRVRANRVWWALCREPGTRWLICWAAGGLVFLSLVPSKRTDRIYPVVAPLSLVVTALLARARRPEGGPEGAPEARWPLAWARVTTGAAVIFTVSTTVGYIVHTYQHHEDAPSQFGAQVRAATVGQAIEMVTGRQSVGGEEAMIVYLRRLRFLPPAEAIQLESTGHLDAVVCNERDLPAARGVLEPFDPAHPALVSGGEPPRSLLLAKPVPTPKPTLTPTPMTMLTPMPAAPVHIHRSKKP